MVWGVAAFIFHNVPLPPLSLCRAFSKKPSHVVLSLYFIHFDQQNSTDDFSIVNSGFSYETL
jgi:hypothetical protein